MAKSGTVGINFIIQEGKDGFKRLIVDAESLKKVMTQTLQVTKQLNHRSLNFATIATGIEKCSSAANQLMSSLNSLSQENRNFTDAMKVTNTMAGKDSAGFMKMKERVSELAKEVPVARDALANGLYQVISNGVPEDNWLTFLKASARSATGGVADLGKVVGVTSTLIKNYSLEWDQAAAMQDKIQLTAKNGVTSFEQLADALPRVTGNAATLGVSIDELMASFATLTGVSGNTAEVSTQLAAIFSALVKPSSEATKTAAAMGIQFDAAAIKAAGGFRQFLTSLDQSVKAYSAASGVLDQEVYGKLFGSAESLRALVPLQGALAQKFSENVDAMRGSAGTMDAAFADVASTSDASAQMVANRWAALTDFITGAAAKIAPVLNFSAPLLTSFSSILMLSQACRTFSVTATIVAMKTRILAAATSNWTGVTRGARAMLLLLNGSLQGTIPKALATMQAVNGIKIAFKGLLVSSGIGLAIWGVSAAIEYLTGASAKASSSMDMLSVSEDRARDSAEKFKASQDQMSGTLEQQRSQLIQHITTLKNFNGTKEEEQRLVNELNGAYGATMGYFKSVAEWYDALVRNSKAYCQQMITEARTRLLADRIAQLDQEQYDRQFDEYGNPRQFSTTRSKSLKAHASPYASTYGPGVYLEMVENQDSEWDEYQRQKAAYQKSRAALRKQLENERNKTKTVMPVKGTPHPPKSTATPTGNDKKGGNSSTGSTTESSGPEWSDLPKTIREYEDDIKILRDLQLDADKQTSAIINSKIKEYTEAADTIRNAGMADDFFEAPKNIKEVEESLRVLRNMAEKASIEERADINAAIADYQALGEEYNTATELDIKKLNTVRDLDKALAHYSAKRHTASADELADIRKETLAIERKKAAMLRSEQLAETYAELHEIASLPEKEYKLHIKAIGIDGMKEKIRDLQKMLRDTDNPLTDGQKEQVETLIRLYRDWGKECVSVSETISDAWSGAQGLESGVNSITDALGENATAWERINGLVTGFMQVMESIRKVVGIIDSISEVTHGLTTATESHTAAVQSETVATEADATASLGNMAAKGGEAVAGAASSGASLPFPANLAAIAAGVAAVVGVLGTAIGFAGKFATGGIVGGSSYSGDRLYARVNSGEMILNPRQQRRLFAMLDGTVAMPGVCLPQAMRIEPSPAYTDIARSRQAPDLSGMRVNFRISGRDLVGVIANETRVASKTGRKTNIKL